MIPMSRHLHAAAPPPSGDTPATILGANVISWFDVATAGLHQDTARTTVAANGDPVASVADAVSGYWTSAGTQRPTYNVSGGLHSLQLRRADFSYLTKALSRSGAVYMLFAASVQNTISGDLGYPMMLYQDSGSWWNSGNLFWVNNGYFDPDDLFHGHSASGGTEAGGVDSPGLATPAVFEMYSQSTTLGWSLNGATDTTATGSGSPPTTSFADIGTPISEGSRAAQGCDLNLYGMAIANTAPDSTQRADLRAWAAALAGVSL